MVDDPTEEYLSVAEAERRAAAFLQTLEEPSVAAAALQADAEALFVFLGDQLTLLQKLAYGYPETLIRADVWTDGVALAAIGRRLTHALRQRGFLPLEAAATQVWLMATLQVQSHHLHIVGPTMLAGADCQERLGNHVEAAEIYDALIEDFAGLIDEAERGEISEENWVALEALETALDRRQQTIERRRLRARLKALPAPAAA